ncbi:helicase-related protein [Thioalkalivibrio sp. XN279]|uniref:helicase-related protein n=1 Tax=Thioalkalivibrio sp. XN279 TaxID=2714953 RepID=UPI001408BB95|nr:helicase-related protein [Thioalkalivibrio sp. XN279]NHA14143.1 helicase [Thioalkalivibrio sp. XN279]
MSESEQEVIRSRLVAELSKVLCGPGEPEEILASSPSDTYLTGILWPKETGFGPDEDEGLDKSAEGRDDDAIDAAVPGYRAIRPCSLGLTFSVPKGTPVRLTTASTARYLPEEILSDQPEVEALDVPDEDVADGDVKPPAVADVEQRQPDEDAAEERRARPIYRWRRKQLNYVLDINPRDESKEWKVSRFQLPDGTELTDPDLAVHVRYRVSEEHVTITATLINLAPNETLGGLPLDANYLFQAGVKVINVGDGLPLQVMPRKLLITADDQDSRSNTLIYRDAREFAVGHGVSATWPASEIAADWVATTWLPTAVVKSTSFKGHESLAQMRRRSLNPFAAEWLGKNENRPAVVKAMHEFCDIYERWITGYVASRVGEFDGLLAEAAAYNRSRCDEAAVRMRRGAEALESNDTVWRAFILANQALDAQARYESKGARAGPLVWRPFQLAFILLVIPGIADPQDKDRETMDLLWFPTGGGKTEAYLGLTAFSIFHTRLTSRYRREQGGTDVLMRYTLRLLTVQQFQRAAALITSCESLRLENPEELGTAPIELGLYVGDESTPNKLNKAREKLDEERSGSRPRSTPRQLLNCPLCNTELAVSDYSVHEEDVRLDIKCHSDQCEWYGRRLPIHTTDETIFKSPPALLIGTVDKFAQLPRKAELGRIFGLDTPNRPELIIQDELHLISGPLGTVTGLYESAIDLLCSISGALPKVIGSTATIGQAEAQVLSLFNRSVLQFPPPGIDSSDSFFAVRDDIAPDRLYLGVSSAGRSPKFALQAVFGAAMQSVQSELELGSWSDDDIDPYWTTVAYFNSLRELGGAIVMTLDDVPRTMQFIAGRQGTSVRPMQQEPMELSSRIPSSKIPEELNKLNIKLGGDPWSGEPVDAVLASNMISVGVDVPRLGLMVVNGQPKSTAEYIQATSRVGRGIPGLVCTVLNFGRPRDLAHFEHFQNYHAALYRNVEATSVTPWAPRARDKALHAILIATLRQLTPGLRKDDEAREFNPDHPLVRQVVDFLVERSRLASNGVEESETRDELDRVVQRWAMRAAEQRAIGKKLRYWEAPAPPGRVSPHLMRDAEKMRISDTPAWPTPNSMREIEPSTAFVLKVFHDAAGGSEGDQ